MTPETKRHIKEISISLVIGGIVLFVLWALLKGDKGTRAASPSQTGEMGTGAVPDVSASGPKSANVVLNMSLPKLAINPVYTQAPAKSSDCGCGCGPTINSVPDSAAKVQAAFDAMAKSIQDQTNSVLDAYVAAANKYNPLLQITRG